MSDDTAAQTIAQVDTDPIETLTVRIARPRDGRDRSEEVANAALFLLSGEASYIPAMTLAVDGGSSA